MMHSIYIRDFKMLKKILEDPENWRYYSDIIGGGRILRAKVEMYEHDDGAKIAGKEGRWWVYVHIEYVPRGRGAETTHYEYDIALWKLSKTPLLRSLIDRDVIEIREESEHEKISV